MASDANVVELLLRLVLSMGLIVAIIVVAAKVMKGRTTLNFGRRKNDGPKLDILDKTQVARHAQVAVVRVGGRGLIVGITEHSVTLLAEAPELVDRYELAAGGSGTDVPISTMLRGTDAIGVGENDNLAVAMPLRGTDAFGVGDNPVVAVPLRGENTEAEWTGLQTEQAAPGRTRMNFFEALRESTVRRS
jgi:flagellar biogenesis protein FliO